MNNKKRLKFIKQNYLNNRAISLLPKEEQEEALLTYATSLLEIVPKKLYKYRICNDNNLNTAFFSGSNMNALLSNSMFSTLHSKSKAILS